MAGGGLLEGKVAVVTGGGGGIGRGISERFASEGASVVVAEIDALRAGDTVSAIGAASTSVVVDVTTEQGAQRAIATALDAFGGLDILLNNVGHYGGRRVPFHEQTDDEWEHLHDINLGHVLRCTRAAIPALLERGGGSVINLSTIEAFRGIPGRAVYSAYKAAITGFTRSLALDLARERIRVNAIAPDVTETLQVPYARLVPEEQQHRIPTWVPLGRFGMPTDVAGVALFLASDLAAFVTGTTVHVDGGTFAAGGWFPTDEGGWTNRPRNP